jgi:uroporphyrinogen-III synthase
VRIIVTRVQPQAQQWVAQLQKLGFDACALPLIEVRAVTDVAPLQAAWRDLSNCAAVMFVSRAAVDYFFKENSGLGVWSAERSSQVKEDPAGAGAGAGAGRRAGDTEHSILPPRLLAPVDKAPGAIKPRYWATGPGTARALLAHGVAAEQLDSPSEQAGQFDSEALWARVQLQVKPGDRVLIVRGDSDGDEPQRATSRPGVGRDWLAEQLTRAGACVNFVVAYRRGPPAWRLDEQALARASASDGALWLLSSSEAVAHLQDLLPGQGWASARALATHPRIAEAARLQGFGQVTVTRPTLDDVVASIKSFA